MLVLAEGEVREWLGKHGLHFQPYKCDSSGFSGYHEQVAIRCGAYRLGAVLVGACSPFKEALLHVEDWSHYSPDQMAIFVAARVAHGEHRPLVGAAGHLFDFAERDLLASMLGLSVLFGWEAYLYLDRGPTFLNWDGELLDMWLPEGDVGEVRLWLENSNVVEHKKPDGFPSGF